MAILKKQVRSLLCTSMACLSLLVCLHAATMLCKYTPLYRPLECRELHSGLEPPAMDASWLNITGSMRKQCGNPNPYVASVSQRRAGEVFVLDNSSLLPVGRSHVPDAEFPAQGIGEGESVMTINLPMAVAQPLLAKPLLQVVTTLHIRSTGSLSFFGVDVSSHEDKDEVCGFEVKVAEMKVGPSRCAPLLEDLAIPSVDSSPEVSYVRMNPAHLNTETLKKNLAFGSVISFFGALFLACLFVSLRGRCGPRPSQNVVREVDNLKV